ncbi:histidine kinase dimerization/phospho-acceptor domain-containing protein [Xanthobacteraceae bacterium Astr-EGSB]|uniref:histidine kinase dimerization/phospho-acceptor domain-containing protein n=1 Tax=Astrobacterium formosum TaxID=3069710 RepID=UPI0027B6EA3C|nr:histidine kinase dimerization/phospho-acceptor domain-containing protein [Xanthobacteraceae bacterium Astr-EGSB]
MNDLPSYRELLADARIAPHATSARPAWLWSTDGHTILWANAVGAAIFTKSARPVFPHRLEPRDALTTQIARLAGTLAHGGQPRLERLRGIGGGLARPLLCSCVRVVMADHVPAILVTALETSGPKLALGERARRLVDAVTEPGEAAAAYSAHGELLYATAAAETVIGASALRRLGAGLMTDGHTPSREPDAPTNVARFGQGEDIVVVGRFAPSESPAPAEPGLAGTEPQTATSLLPADGDGTEKASPTPDEQAPSFESVVPDSCEPATEWADPEATDSESTESGGSGAEENESQPDSSPSGMSPLSLEGLWFERRHPLRFVWQMDSEGRFTLGSEEFSEVIGPRLTSTLGRPWLDVAGELALDPENQVARAIATRDTWSGITVSWPVEGSSDRLKVEMSGLPIFDRTRTFLGYRGFGVCRDIDRINVLTHMRRQGPLEAPIEAPAEASPEAPASVDPSAPVEHAPPANDAGDVAEPETAAPAADASERTVLSLVPPAKNVVPFRGSGEAMRAPALSAVEHNAFRELARQLTARLSDNGDADDGTANDMKPEPAENDAETVPTPESPEPSQAASPVNEAMATGATDEAEAEASPTGLAIDRALLERLPVGLLIYRFDELVFANRAFLDWSGQDSLDAFAEAGGLDSLLVDNIGDADAQTGTRLVEIGREDAGRKSPGRLFSIPFGADTALVLVIDEGAGTARREAKAAEAMRRAENEARELAFVVEAASDAVFIVDRERRVASANRRAQSLFGRSGEDMVATPLLDLFAPESQRVVRHQFDVLARGEGEGGVTDGREVAAHVGANAHLALLMTIGRIGEAGDKFCVVLRDITTWKAQERELVAAKLQAERASRAKSDFLAKISHEIRTPLNSIIGFSDVMIEERFGPIGNERYREYLKDIRASGEHVVSLLNDLLDLAKIEAGKLELNMVAVNLNEMIQSCVMLMQPQANREHIIIRTSLMSSVKPVIADAKAVRQIVLNLLSNSIKFTGAGGQVIVSTAHGDDGSAMMRVRDTGIGMNESDLAAALEPFRQLATAARWGSSGTGLGLPLTKALVEANRANFAISSKINEGTLVEITFPASRVANG